MNVLSLFDGISCGYAALKRAGIPFDKYYSSEIEPRAIEISKANCPDEIRLGDVTKWKTWDIDFSKIDLLIGGSPCTNLSVAGNRMGLEGIESKLFYVYVDILNAIRKVNPDVIFMLENVIMAPKWKQIMTEMLGSEPVFINSRLVSGQQRQRLYWSNRTIRVPKDRHITLQSILTGGGIAEKEKAYCLIHGIGSRMEYFKRHQRTIVFEKITDISVLEPHVSESSMNAPLYVRDKTVKMKFAKSSTPDKIWTFPCNLPDGVYSTRHLTVTEVERLQTLPEGYLKMCRFPEAIRTAGLGWTVDVIAGIFTDILSGKKQETLF